MFSPPSRSIVDGFRFGSGRLCFAFTATLGDRLTPAPVERLREPADLTRWARAAGLEGEAPLAATAADLVAARRLREAVYRVADAARAGPGSTLAQEDLAVVNDFAARPALAPALGPDGSAGWVPARDVEEVLALVARDAIATLAVDRARLRRCADAGCGGLFVDTTHPGNRRWCSMSTCGNRAKKAALRARRARSQTAGAH